MFSKLINCKISELGQGKGMVKSRNIKKFSKLNNCKISELGQGQRMVKSRNIKKNFQN